MTTKKQLTRRRPREAAGAAENELESRLEALTSHSEDLVRRLGAAEADLAAADRALKFHGRGRTTLLDSLMQERLDLLGRIVRVDQRLEALGQRQGNEALTLLGKRPLSNLEGSIDNAN